MLFKTVLFCRSPVQSLAVFVLVTTPRATIIAIMSAEQQNSNTENIDKHFAMRPIGAYPPLESARSCPIGEGASSPPPSLFTPPFQRHAFEKDSSAERRQFWSSGSSSPPLSSVFSLSPPPQMANGHHFFHHLAAEEVQLMDAAANNRIDCLTQIIRSGEVSVDATDSHHFTALMYAATNGHMNIIRRLIDLGATVDFAQPVNRRDTALHMAAQCGHTRSVELLLKYGHANAHLLNAAGKTAFDLARDFGHGSNKVMRRLFEEAGALGTNEMINGRVGHRHLKQHQQQADCFDSCCSLSPPFNSKYSVNNNTKNRKQQSRSGAADDKQHSLLPNIELLKVFSATGIYRPMLSGTGFSLLTPNVDLVQKLEYARLALELPAVTADNADSWQMLHDGLLAIKQAFEEDLLLKKHDSYMALVNVQTAAVAAATGRTESVNQHNYNQQHQQQQQQKSLDDEKAAYLQWKRSNMDKLEELLEVVKCVSIELSIATNDCAGEGGDNL